MSDNALATAGLALSNPVAITDAQAWPVVRTVPGRLRVHLRMPNMTLRTANKLRVGQLLLSAHAETMDVPMCLGGVQLCWCEFSAVDERMAVRITQLA